MKTKVIITILLILILCGVNLVQADTTWTEGHHEINDGDVYGEIVILNDVTLDIFGGDIYYVFSFDSTITNWYDGQMDYFGARGDSIVNIYGGQAFDFIGAIDNSQINLFAYDVIHTTTGGHYGFGQVFGKYYYSDLNFSFDLGNSETYSHINIIPEPTTILLFGLGSLIGIIRRK